MNNLDELFNLAGLNYEKNKSAIKKGKMSTPSITADITFDGVTYKDIVLPYDPGEQGPAFIVGGYRFAPASFSGVDHFPRSYFQTYMHFTILNRTLPAELLPFAVDQVLIERYSGFGGKNHTLLSSFLPDFSSGKQCPKGLGVYFESPAVATPAGTHFCISAYSEAATI